MYTYGSQNNGNVLQAINCLDSTRTQSFGYDSLNRIQDASTSDWSQGFTVDPWGNLTAVHGNNAPGFSYSESLSSGEGTVAISGAEQSLLRCTGGQCVMLYDNGTVSITVGGYTAGVNYNDDDGNPSTPSSIAAGLAQIFHQDIANSPVDATAAAGVITLTARGGGSETNYPLSVAVTYDTWLFQSASFAAAPSGPNLSEGTGSQSALTAGQHGPI